MRFLSPVFRVLIRQQWVAGLSVQLVKRLFGLRVLGAEYARRHSPAIFVGNHVSHYDGVFAFIMVRDATGQTPVAVAWEGIREFPVFREIIETRALDLILKGKGAGTLMQRAAAFLEASDWLEQGRSLLVFAEGERKDVLGDFMHGAALASLRTGIPIVPFSICGTERLFPNLPIPRRIWGRVSLQFHPPLLPPKVPLEAQVATIEQLTSEVRRAVAGAISYDDGRASPSAP